MDEDLRELHDKVEHFGWAVVHTEDEGDGPGFSYSVGLHRSFQHPEVIAFGLREDTRQQILNNIANQVRSGVRFEPNQTSDQVLNGFDCAFRAVAPGAVRYYMGMAVRFYDADVPALHCVWPDRNGHFPWDAASAAEYRWLQPMLSEGPESFTTARP